MSFALKNQKAARLIFELLAVETINFVVSEGSIAFTEVSYAKAVSYYIRILRAIDNDNVAAASFVPTYAILSRKILKSIMHDLCIRHTLISSIV